MSAEQKALSRKFLIYKFATKMWFVGTVWLFFYRVFMTDAEIGLMESAAFFVGLLVEVPSGVLADRFGRAKVLKIGLMVSIVGFMAQASSQIIDIFGVILAFQIGVTAGQSLLSGADEALFYEKLKFKEGSHHWRKLMTRGGQVALIGTLSANVMGGIIYTFSPHLTWILNGLGFAIALIAIWNIKDESVRREKKAFRESLKDYFANIGVGFREFGKPRLRIYLPLILTLQGLFYMFGWWMKLMFTSRFGFSPLEGTILLAACGIISVIAMHLIHRYSEKLHEKRVLTFIAMATVFSLIFSAFDIGWWGGIVVILIYLSGEVIYPFMSEVLNKEAKSEQRSTVLSVASFFSVLPYVALAPIIGALNDADLLWIFLVVWAALVAGAWAYYIINKRKDTLVKTEEFENMGKPTGVVEAEA